MPQLVKGGKYVYGWTSIQNDGHIRIPDEAYDDYHFKENGKIILISGSRISGGFSTNPIEAIEASEMGPKIFDSIGFIKESRLFTSRRGSVFRSGTRSICWTACDENRSFSLPEEFMDLLDLKIGSKLLVGRGSGVGPFFIERGPIYNEALKHKSLAEYEK